MTAWNQPAREIAAFMRRLYQRGLTTTSGGNISVRLDANTILMTPGGTDKARIKAADIGAMSLQGERLSDFKPTCEAEMHLAIYRARPDVSAIVHAHPVTASAFAAAACPISNRLLCESYVILGEINLVQYQTLGSPQLAAAAAAAAGKYNCLLLQNHGALALGSSLLQAFDRLEVLENAARTTLICEHLLKAPAQLLPAAALPELQALRPNPPPADIPQP